MRHYYRELSYTLQPRGSLKYYWLHVSGRRLVRTFDTKDRKEAVRLAEATIDECLKGPKATTLGQAVKILVRDPETRDRRIHHEPGLTVAFFKKSYPLWDLTTARLYSFVENLVERGVYRRAVEYEFIALESLLLAAVERGWIEVMPKVPWGKIDRSPEMGRAPSDEAETTAQRPVTRGRGRACPGCGRRVGWPSWRPCPYCGDAGEAD